VNAAIPPPAADGQGGLDLPGFLKRDQPEARKSSWRDTVRIHPACELIPPVSDAELDALGEDILKNGLSVPIAITPDGQLLDGRSRLDALAKKDIRVSLEHTRTGAYLRVDNDNDDDARALERTLGDWGTVVVIKTDPVAYVISANVHRRHLTAEQKRNLIAKLLKAEPAKSDRQIGKMVKADHKTVASVRTSNGEIPHKAERTEATGRKARGRKPTSIVKAKDTEKPAATTAAEPTPARKFFAQRIHAALARAQSGLKGMFDAAGEIGLTEVMLGEFLNNTPHTPETHAIVSAWLDAGEAAE
jgi:hypothetical protein